MTTQKTTLIRDSRGALHAPSGSLSGVTDADRAIYAAATALIAAAVAARKISCAYDGLIFDPKNGVSGDTRYHEIYDIAPAGAAALVCVRAAVYSKYNGGVYTSGVSYYLIRARSRGVSVVEANKALAAKAAKSAGRVLGEVIAVVTGKLALTVPGGCNSRRQEAENPLRLTA